MSHPYTGFGPFFFFKLFSSSLTFETTSTRSGLTVHFGCIGKLGLGDWGRGELKCSFRASYIFITDMNCPHVGNQISEFVDSMLRGHIYCAFEVLWKKKKKCSVKFIVKSHISDSGLKV